jgi:hypothetical protein
MLGMDDFFDDCHEHTMRERNDLLSPVEQGDQIDVESQAQRKASYGQFEGLICRLLASDPAKGMWTGEALKSE